MTPTNTPTKTPTAVPSVTPTEVACETIDNAEDLTELDSRALEQRDLVIKQSKKALKQGFLGKKEQAKYEAAAKSAYVVSWSAVWSIPSIVRSCDEAPSCVQVSLEGRITSYLDTSLTLKNLADNMAARIKKKGGKSMAETTVKKAKALHKDNVKTASTLPTTTSVCP